MGPRPKSGSRSQSSTRDAVPDNSCPGWGRVKTRVSVPGGELPGHGPARFYAHVLFTFGLTRARMVLESGMEQSL